MSKKFALDGNTCHPGNMPGTDISALLLTLVISPTALSTISECLMQNSTNANANPEIGFTLCQHAIWLTNTGDAATTPKRRPAIPCDFESDLTKITLSCCCN